MKKILAYIVIFILVANALLLIPNFILEGNTVTGDTFTVNDDGGASFVSIQAAIDNALPGDTIKVWSGIYNENIIVNKTLKIVGNSTIDTIIDGGANGNVISILADNVAIRNFTIRNSGNANCGIVLYGTQSNNIIGCLIQNNICTNNGYGINLINSSNNEFHYNNVSSNKWGFTLEYSSNNTIANHTINNNLNDGINCESSSNNTIKDNIIDLNGGSGISLEPMTNDYLFDLPEIKPGNGNIYYVTTTGNNNNNGSSEQNSWRTMKYAASKVIAGDTVYVKKGNYGRDPSNWPSGSSGKPIRIIGYNSFPNDIISVGYPSVKDTEEMPKIGSGGGDTLIRLGSYCEVYNFYIYDNTYGIALMSCQYGKIINCYVNATIYGLVLNDEYSDPVTSHHLVENCSVINSSARGYSIEHCNNSVFRGCYMESHYRTDYPFVLESSSYNIIENCVLKHQKNSMYGQAGWAHSGHGIDIKDSCSQKSVEESSKYNIIRNCTRIGTEMARGIELAGRCSNNTIENCSNLGYWWIHNGPQYNTIKDCEFNGGLTLNMNVGEYPFVSPHNNTFERVIFKDTDYALGLSNCQDNLIINSIFYKISKKIFSLRRDYPMNITIRNCIFYDVAGFEHSVIDPGPTDPECDYYISYSNFYDCSFTKPSGTGNIQKDPLFVDAANYDFHLKSANGTWDGTKWILYNVTSPCIDAGNPGDYYYREPQPNGGRINMGLYGDTSKASKSPTKGEFGDVETPKSTSPSLKNKIINNHIYDNKYGMSLLHSSGNIIIDNDIKTIDDDNWAIQLSSSSKNNYIKSNKITTYGDSGHGIILLDFSTNSILDCKITINGKNAYGLYSINSVSTTENSQFSSNNDSYDLAATFGGEINTINTQYTNLQLTNNGGGKLTVMNYLDVQVYNNNGVTPLSEVDLEVKNNGNTIYSTSGYGGGLQKTNSAGRIDGILTTDRIYIKSNSAINYKTDIRLKKTVSGLTWQDERLNLNMRTTHTESFIASEFITPPVPDGLEVTRVGDTNSINITWNQNTGTNYYSVHTKESDKWIKITEVNHPQNWFVHENLDDNVNYQYKLKSWNQYNFASQFSEARSYFLEDITPPETPEELTAKSVRHNDAINISWKLNTDDTVYYELFWLNITTEIWEQIASVSQTQYHYIYTNSILTNSVKYSFKIRAKDKVSLFSLNSTPIEIIHRDYLDPNPPTNVQCKEITLNSMVISWDKSIDTDVKYYNLFMNKPGFGSGGPYSLLDKLTGTSYDLNGLTPQTKYYFVIQALDEANNTSPYSDEAFSTTLSSSEIIQPEIVHTLPVQDAENVRINTSVKIIFNVPMSTSSVEGLIIINPYVDFNFQWSNKNQELIIVFSNDLNYNTTYKLEIGNIKSSDGLVLKNAIYQLIFTTEEFDEETGNDPSELKQTIKIEKPKPDAIYYPGEFILITGSSSGLKSGTIVNIKMYDLETNSLINTIGEWSLGVSAPDTEGTYLIQVSVNGFSDEVQISVKEIDNPDIEPESENEFDNSSDNENASTEDAGNDRSESETNASNMNNLLLLPIIGIIIFLIFIFIFIRRNRENKRLNEDPEADHFSEDGTEFQPDEKDILSTEPVDEIEEENDIDSEMNSLESIPEGEETIPSEDPTTTKTTNENDPTPQINNNNNNNKVKILKIKMPKQKNNNNYNINDSAGQDKIVNNSIDQIELIEKSVIDNPDKIFDMEMLNENENDNNDINVQGTGLPPITAEDNEIDEMMSDIDEFDDILNFDDDPDLLSSKERLDNKNYL